MSSFRCISLASHKISLALIRNLKGWAVLRSHLAPVIDARRCDIRVPEPFLDLCDIGVVVERVGRRGRTQRVRPEAGNINFQRRRITAGQHLVHAIGRDRCAGILMPVVFDWPEQRALFVGALAGRQQVRLDPLGGSRMQRHIAQLAALALDPQMHDPASRLQVADRQRTAPRSAGLRSRRNGRSVKQRELKEKMPEVAAFIDWLCDFAGKKSVHGQIRKSLNGEPVFHTRENGHEVGTPLVRGQGITWHRITGCAIPVDLTDEINKR